jgi:hypothetical protein
MESQSQHNRESDNYNVLFSRSISTIITVHIAHARKLISIKNHGISFSRSIETHENTFPSTSKVLLINDRSQPNVLCLQLMRV